MLSIDRVRTTTLNLLGLGSGSRATGAEPNPSDALPERGDHGEEADPSASRTHPFSFEDPAFAAVATALREAGYLDS